MSQPIHDSRNSWLRLLIARATAIEANADDWSINGFALQNMWLRQVIGCQGKTEALGESAVLRQAPELLEKQVFNIVMTLLNRSRRRPEGLE